MIKCGGFSVDWSSVYLSDIQTYELRMPAIIGGQTQALFLVSRQPLTIPCQMERLDYSSTKGRYQGSGNHVTPLENWLLSSAS